MKSKLTKISKNINKVFLLIFISQIPITCIEPFDAVTETFESALVIEATITDELKRQEIALSRTFAFEEEGPNAEEGATLKVLDEAGNEYLFEETTPGIYLSLIAFNATPSRSYQLSVTTTDGRSYTSTTQQLTNTTAIDELYASRTTNDDGVEGIAIYIDSFDPTNSSKNYRYDYSETYKIIAPDWRPEDLESTPEEGMCAVSLAPKQGEERVCYSTVSSNTIILTDTNGFDEDRVSKFPVRFIDRADFIISHRYSILVRQFVQSKEAFAFYKTLRDFSGQESLFSETQPGFLAGNVFSEASSDEKVLGYFDVASVTEKRIFFDYEDFFPGEELPPYADPCQETSPQLISLGEGCVLSVQLELDLVKYIGDNPSPGNMEGPYTVVPRVCGDCTALGKTEIPEFWIE